MECDTMASDELNRQILTAIRDTPKSVSSFISKITSNTSNTKNGANIISFSKVLCF